MSFVVIALMASLLPGQAAVQLTEAVGTITAQDVVRHVRELTHDSMLGRDTPSRGLELTAKYVAEQFQALGLKPGASTINGRTWLHRYPIPVQYDFARSRVVFAAGSKSAVAEFGTAARLVDQGLPKAAENAGVLLMTGRFYNEPLRDVARRNKIILYIPPAGEEGSLPPKVFGSFAGHNLHSSHGVIVLSNEDSATFHRDAQAQVPLLTYQSTASLWQVHVRPEAATGLRDVLAAAGLDLARLRADTIPQIRDLPSLQVSFEPAFTGTPGDTTTAPNVLGFLEGSDPKIKNELIVVTAHMDHAGVHRDRTDSVNTAANDNASGVAGLLELAEAFSRSGVRPRRSIMFVAVSGGTKPGFWGSTFYASELANLYSPIIRTLTVPRPVFSLNLDILGGGAGDTVTMYGLNSLELVVPPAWIAGAHPELRLALRDGGTPFTPRSDHFAFSAGALMLPSLSVQTGTHNADRPTGTSATIDADLTARILRFVFYVSREIANADKPPQWNAEGRRQAAESIP